jgi:CHASE2 domain-containing sensor protein
VPYSVELMKAYEWWSDSYKGYYSVNRARPGVTGTVASKQVNWEGQLTLAEKDLILAFRKLWKERELEPLREVLRSAGRTNESLNLLVKCGDCRLSRLPWELLENEVCTIAEVDVSVLRTVNQIVALPKRMKRTRLRILAILADDGKGVDSKKEQTALREILKEIAYIEFAGHTVTKTQPNAGLKLELKERIEDEQGWDILFFAGHSHEEEGREIQLAKDYWVAIEDFELALKRAKTLGLQFALFNSCEGSVIAEKLVGFGLNRVVVMREVINNDIAYAFLTAFATRLASFKDVQAATVMARRDLRNQSREDYKHPSAYLVPSIYGYRGVRPLALSPLNWRVLLYRLRPTRCEAFSLLVLGLLSLNVGWQHALIDNRQAIQAIYQAIPRDLQHLISDKPVTLRAPSIQIVELDKASLKDAKDENGRPAIQEPIDRLYLSRLVKKANELGVKTIGVDYVLLDRELNREKLMEEIKKSEARFVFGASHEWDNGGVADSETVPSESRIDGDIGVNAIFDRSTHPVFMARTIGDPSTFGNPSPHPLPYQLWCLFKNQSPNCTLPNKTVYYNPIGDLGRRFGQYWLNPWIDYSKSARDVYQVTSSKNFLMQAKRTTDIILIAPSDEFDAFNLPKAMSVNEAIDERQDPRKPNTGKISGARIHAYLLDDLLQQRSIVGVPDLWMVGIMGIVGKLLSLRWQQQTKDRRRSKRQWVILAGGVPIVGAIVCLQLYTMLGIAVPILFSTLTYWAYLLPQSNFLRGKWYRLVR